MGGVRLGGAVLLILAIALARPDEGFARTVRTANFLVDAPSTKLARQIGQRAEQLRRAIALEWLGSELPRALHVNLIYVEIDAGRSTGRTVVSPTNRGHLVTLIGSLEEVTENLLAHEVAHTVLAARYGLAMPAWANEGIASRYDDAGRQAIRAVWLKDFSRERLWPDLIHLMEEPIRSQSSYAAAASVTEFLLELGNRPQFLMFVEDGQQRGWDAALQSHYNIYGQAHLAAAWQRWVAEHTITNKDQRLASVPSDMTFVAHRRSAAMTHGL